MIVTWNGIHCLVGFIILRVVVGLGGWVRLHGLVGNMAIRLGVGVSVSVVVCGLVGMVIVTVTLRIGVKVGLCRLTGSWCGLFDASRRWLSWWVITSGSVDDLWKSLGFLFGPYGFEPSSYLATDRSVTLIMNTTELRHVHMVGADANGIIRRKDCRVLRNNLFGTVIVALNAA